MSNYRITDSRLEQTLFLPSEESSQNSLNRAVYSALYKKNPSIVHKQEKEHKFMVTIKSLAAAATAGLVALIYNSLFSTFPHEYGHVGALYLTKNISSGLEPSVTLNVSETWSQFLQNKSVYNFFRFLLFSRGGETSYNRYSLNPLGKMMGSQGTSAFVSFAGSVPALLVDSSAVAWGISNWKEQPVLGSAIASFGMIDHLLNCEYPLQAAFMSKTDLFLEARSGHDFANVAVNIGEMTGIDPRLIAGGTALGYVALVPLIGIMSYLYQKKQQLNLVPDHMAIKRWIYVSRQDKKAKVQFNHLLKKYPFKSQLYKACSEFKSQPDSHRTKKNYENEMALFYEYLIEHLDRNIILSQKRRILQGWEKHQAPDRIQRRFQYFGFAGAAFGVSLKVAKVLSETVVPNLAATASVLGYANPIFTTISILSNAYDTVKDLRSSSEKIPKMAKMLSVSKLVVSITASTLVLVGVFVPGMNVVLIVGVVLGATVPTIIGFMKYKIVKNKFELDQALSEKTSRAMIKRLKVIKELKSKNRITADFLKRHHPDIFHWYRLVKRTATHIDESEAATHGKILKKLEKLVY